MLFLSDYCSHLASGKEVVGAVLSVRSSWELFGLSILVWFRHFYWSLWLLLSTFFTLVVQPFLQRGQLYKFQFGEVDFRSVVILFGFFLQFFLLFIS